MQGLDHAQHPLRFLGAGSECYWPPSDAAVTGHSFPEYKMPVPWGRTPERGSWYSDLQLALLGYSSQGD